MRITYKQKRNIANRFQQPFRNSKARRRQHNNSVFISPQWLVRKAAIERRVEYHEEVAKQMAIQNKL